MKIRKFIMYTSIIILEFIIGFILVSFITFIIWTTIKGTINGTTSMAKNIHISMTTPKRPRPEFVFHSTVQVEVVEKQHILDYKQPDGLGGFRYVPERYYIRAINNEFGLVKIFSTRDIFDTYKEGDFISVDLYKSENSEEYKF